LIRPKNLLATSLLAVACLAGRFASADEPAPAQHSGRTITAVGRGTVSAEADSARMVVVVNSEGSFAQDAMAAQKLKVKRLVEALRGAGISEADITTAPPQFTPRFASPNLVPAPPAAPQTNALAQPVPQPVRAPVQAKRDGFQVSTTVTSKTRNLENLGTVVDLIADNADNHVPTIAFFVADPKSALDEARRKAFDEAERLAALEAERAHLKLGGVRSVRDATLNQFSDILAASAAVGNANAMTQSFTAGLEVQWDAEP
jgi:uncharacterized protein YggE